MIIVKFSNHKISKFKSFDILLLVKNYNKITYINCNKNNLTSLPKLPEHLLELECGYNKLRFLPELPIHLQMLYCPDNELEALPKLPQTLLELYCSNNNLSILPEIPSNIIQIECNHNKLTRLPDNIICLKNLIEIGCTNMSLQLTELQKKFISQLHI
jgi:Leucine-rich repeat (LRR) protein